MQEKAAPSGAWSPLGLGPCTRLLLCSSPSQAGPSRMSQVLAPPALGHAFVFCACDAPFLAGPSERRAGNGTENRASNISSEKREGLGEARFQASGSRSRNCKLGGTHKIAVFASEVLIHPGPHVGLEPENLQPCS